MLPHPIAEIGGYVIPPPKRRVRPFFLKPIEDHLTAMLDDIYEMESDYEYADTSDDEDEEMPTVVHGVCLKVLSLAQLFYFFV